MASSLSNILKSASLDLNQCKRAISGLQSTRYYANSSNKKFGVTEAKISKSIPRNVEETLASQKAKFSPIRSRETSSARISNKSPQQMGNVFTPKFMGDQKSNESKKTSHGKPSDSHVNVYDCSNTVSLSSVVSSNVPTPYKMDGKRAPSQYNMQGGQSCQGDKYLSGDLHAHHHTSRTSKGSKGMAHASTLGAPRMSWSTNTLVKFRHNSGLAVDATRYFMVRSCFHNSSYRLEELKSEQPPTQELKLSQRQKLKRAVKDYGATVIVFHVTISLASLGVCYLIVSSGLDISGIVKSLGINLSNLQEASDLSTDSSSSSAAVVSSTSESRVEVVAAGVSTFVIAYAIHKVFAPARIAVTLFSTPIIVRHLRKIGFLKVPKS